MNSVNDFGLLMSYTFLFIVNAFDVLFRANEKGLFRIYE